VPGERDCVEYPISLAGEEAFREEGEIRGEKNQGECRIRRGGTLSSSKERRPREHPAIGKDRFRGRGPLPGRDVDLSSSGSARFQPGRSRRSLLKSGSKKKTET